MDRDLIFRHILSGALEIALIYYSAQFTMLSGSNTYEMNGRNLHTTEHFTE